MARTNQVAKKSNGIIEKSEVVNLASPQAIAEFATELKDLIVKNGLFANIKGKNYVNVEGWQIAGAFTGTYPIVETVENLSTDKICRYRAEVSLRDKNGIKVGYGVAICTNKESGKTNFDEYAVASMAQTRAVGKAYRMKIGWLLKIAGYETTPAEEMDAVVTEAQTVEKPSSNRLDFEDLREELVAIDTEAGLLRHFNALKKEHDLSERQLAAVKKIYADRRAVIRMIDKGTDQNVANISQKAATFQAAVDEWRDYDIEAKGQREADEANAISRQATNYEVQREMEHERMMEHDE